MPLRILRALDRWIGGLFLYLLVIPARLLSFSLPRTHKKQDRIVFIKLKGGGSLIVALPALLGLRQRSPDAQFTLVCAREAKIYAELTGLFDRYLVVDDSTLKSLLLSGLVALRDSFASAFCIDLEPNSMLAAVFTMATCAKRRIGFVKAEEPARARAYTDAVSFNPVSPIYAYYDRVAELLGAHPASAAECKTVLQKLLPTPQLSAHKTTIGIAPFTSDFARERMIPPNIWADLLHKEFASDLPVLWIFGAAHNNDAAQKLRTSILEKIPAVEIINLCGFGSLAQAAAIMPACAEIWAIDSGLLHIARALRVPTRSFWGPTMPTQRLRPVDGLAEKVIYRQFLCSPCIQSSTVPPCGGQNLCMMTMAEESPNLRPAWVKQT